MFRKNFQRQTAILAVSVALLCTSSSQAFQSRLPLIPCSTTTASITSSLSMGFLEEPASLMQAAAETSAGSLDLLGNTDFLVFIAGIFPFMWATYEFWRRIMFGESFGTGTDSVIIGMEDSPADSRGRRVLGKGALVTAYVLFVCAFGTLAVVGYSVATSAPPSADDLAAAMAVVAETAAENAPSI